ncbi:helicase protein [Ancylostoma caninum]|uniref:Helicase protein n=2 Tax=Ancylostoma caninum TaxID=29170 RepID=A0A368FLP2_ANCCA|nr:helicase protein [Ancylostoma caninum]
MLFLTEGLLLRQMENDSLLQQYNVIILDEIHERHLSSDLLIGLLRDMIGKREDLKLILMSATINLELFKGYFEGAPVVQVPGRLFPIQLRYHPIKQFIAESEKKSHKIDPEPYVRILELIDKQVPSTERGDALIFLNGVAEITTVAEALKTYAELTKAWIILMLHSTLSVEEQDKVFDVAPSGVRKCILSTNIAETSVTIDGIRFVIDSGKVNLIKHETGSGTQKLSEFWVSKASADQRKGRAGRTGPGICYRLYSEEQYNKMDDFTTSEINRVSLQEMALRMISLNLGLDPRTFPFIERPETEKLNDALDILKFQGVLYADRDNQLTALGNAIAKLPVDVPIAKMLVLGCVVNHVEVMLTVAAGLSVQSPFTNRSYRELDVVDRRARLTSSMGDPFTLIEIFREWVLQKCSGGKVRRWALENGIDEHRMYEISKLRSQYRQVLEDAGLIEKPDAHELGEDDSRQRRIDQGDRKKLLDMKRDARNLEKTRKVLRADKHFDSILNEKEEEDLGVASLYSYAGILLDNYITENEQDPMKADVKTVEFLLSYKQRDVEIIRRTHNLRRKEAEVSDIHPLIQYDSKCIYLDLTFQLIRVVIAAGLYPQYTIPDPMNKYQHGQELFVHTRMKPFSLIHPNSSIAQYHAESLDARADSEGRSVRHQLQFYGLLLETTKPYICNVLPLPALAILLFAKKVLCDDWKLVMVDDFAEISFSRNQQCEEVMHSVVKIRKQLNEGLQRKLRGLTYNPRELSESINRFAYVLAEGDVEISMKRIVHPPRTLENVGFFLPSGEVEIDNEDYGLESAMLDDSDSGGQEEAEEDVTKTSEGVRVKEEAQEKKERKPTYYELLQERMRQREAQAADEQTCEKKPRVD